MERSGVVAARAGPVFLLHATPFRCRGCGCPALASGTAHGAHRCTCSSTSAPRGRVAPPVIRSVRGAPTAPAGWPVPLAPATARARARRHPHERSCVPRAASWESAHVLFSHTGNLLRRLPSSRCYASGYGFKNPRPLERACTPQSVPSSPRRSRGIRKLAAPTLRALRSAIARRETGKEKNSDAVWRPRSPRKHHEAASRHGGRGARANKQAGLRRPTASPSPHTSHPPKEIGALPAAVHRGWLYRCAIFGCSYFSSCRTRHTEETLHTGRKSSRCSFL